MPSLAASLTQLIVLHTVGSSVVDNIGLAETAAERDRAMARYRKHDHPEPPGFVARGWERDTADVGAPLQVLGKGRPGVMLYLHGGSWVVGPNTQQWRTATALADAAELDLAVLAYELAPEGHIDDAIAASVASLDLLAERYELVTVFADSAGGGLALSALQAQRDRGGPTPTLSVLFSPWVDASLDAPDVVAAEGDDVLLSIAGLRACARLFAGDLPLDDPRLSPLHGALVGLPPIELHTGTRELLLGDTRRLHAALEAAGVDARLHEHEGMHHDFYLFPCRESRWVMAEMAARLRRAGDANGNGNGNGNGGNGVRHPQLIFFSLAPRDLGKRKMAQ
jgi:monoterpene epsilon-lactone hydrolase